MSKFENRARETVAREKAEGTDCSRSPPKLNLASPPPPQKKSPLPGLPEGVHDLPAEPLPALLPPSPSPSPAEEDAIVLALPLVALREFRRAAGALARARALNSESGGARSPSLTPRGAFLLAWSRYLAGRARAVAEAGAASAAAASSGGSVAGGGLFGQAATAAPSSAALGGGGGFDGDGDGASLEEVEADLAPYLGGRSISSESGERGEGGEGGEGGGSGAAERGRGDPFCLYLLGLVAADAGRPRSARSALLASVRLFPLNWGAWLALAVLDAAERGGCGGGSGGGSGGARSPPCSSSAAAAAVAAALPLGGLPNHWASHCYLAHVSADAGDDPADALSRARALAGAAAAAAGEGGDEEGTSGGGGRGLPRSPFVAGVAASAHYANRSFDAAGELYEHGLAGDPHRLEGLVNYSNVLYVRGDAAALAGLAARLASTAPFSAAAASVAGNYHSLRGDHGRALACFRRSLALEGPGGGSGVSGGGAGGGAGGAWTLMGHEYIELKNPAAAVASYRRAVSLAPRDHRAWYGLGQAHELLGAPHAALHYFRRAAALRPADARMWLAVGHCLEMLSGPGAAPSDLHPVRDASLAAKKAYRRAVDAGAGAGAALAALARIAEAEGDDAAAAGYHEAVVAAAAARAGGGARGPSPASLSADAAALLDESLAPAASPPPPPPPGPEDQDSLLFLAAYRRDRGEWALAERAALRLLRAALSGSGGALGTEGDATMGEVAELLEDVREARAAAGGGRGGGGREGL